MLLRTLFALLLACTPALAQRTAVARTTPATTLVNGLVSYWNLGSTADAYGANTLTNNNAVTFTASGGKPGGFVTVAGASSQSLSIATNKGLQSGGRSIHICGWFNGTIANTKSILAKADSGPTPGIGEWYLNFLSSKLRFIVLTSAGNIVTATASTFGNLSNSTWYFVDCYIDAAALQIGIAINGGAYNTAAITEPTASGTSALSFGALSDGAAFFSGSLSSVGLWGRKLTTTEVTSLYNAGSGIGYPFPTSRTAAAPLNSGLAAAWNLADLTDASGNARTLTNNNAATFTASGGKPGGYATFVSASSQYLTSTVPMVPFNSFSWGGWFYMTDVTQVLVPFGLFNSGSTGSPGRVLIQTTIKLVGTSAFGNPVIDSSVTPVNNTWYHVVTTYDAITGLYTFYVNAVSKGTLAYANSVAVTTPTFSIGANAASTNAFGGNVSSVFFYSRAISSAEVTSLYNGGSGLAAPYSGSGYGRPTSTPDILSGLSGYWEMEDTGFRDSSGNSNTLTNTNAVTVVNGGKPGNYANFVRASSQKLSIADSTSVQPGTGSYSWCYWVNFASLGSQALISKYDSPDTSRAYLLDYGNVANRFSFVVAPSTSAAAGTAVANTFGAASTGVWYFVAGVYDATAHTISISVNAGTQDSVSYTPSANGQAAGIPLVFGGSNGTDSSFYLNGQLDSIGFWKGRAISAADIAWLYNAGAGRSYLDLLSYRGGIVAPNSIVGLVQWQDASDPATLYQDSALTTPVTANSDPVGGWKDKSGNSHNLLQATAGLRPLYKTAIQNSLPVVRFDGVDDYLKTVAYTLNQPATTFAVMLNRSAANNAHYLLDGNTSVSNAFNFDAANTARFYTGIGLELACDPTIWHVWMGLANGASSVFRLDGLQISGNSGGSGPGGCTIATNGGSPTGNNYTDCDIAEILIYNRVLTAQEQLAIQTYLGRKWGIPAAISRPYGRATPRRNRWAELEEAYAVGPVQPARRDYLFAGAN